MHDASGEKKGTTENCCFQRVTRNAVAPINWISGKVRRNSKENLVYVMGMAYIDIKVKINKLLVAMPLQQY